MKKLLLVAVFLFVASGAFAAQRAIPVMQSTYDYMKFYVYKPKNLPKDFYVTFDGYMVYTGDKGVWKYASVEPSGIVKTNYVVGEVVPSTLNLKPYEGGLSSVTPVLGSDRVDASVRTTQTQQKSTRIIYMPPSSGFETVGASELSPNATDWTQNSNFMAVGNWQKSVDRIGVMSRPMTPIAWKGDYPEVIYAWTGLQWKQMMAKGTDTSLMTTLKRELYNFTVDTNRINMLHWTNDDTHVLSQYAAMWGYQWQGLIIMGRNY